MGLLAAPPVAPGPSAASQTTINPGAAQRIGKAIRPQGAVFGGTNSSGNLRLLKWPDPYQPASFSVFLSSSAFLINAQGLCVDPAATNLYCGGATQNVFAHTSEVTVTQTDIGGFTGDVEVVSQVQLGNADSSNISANNGAVACDGTYVYYLLANQDQNSWIGKFQLSDGSLAASLQIPNPTGGLAQNGQALQLDGGNLFAAGGLFNMWAAVVPVSLSGPTVLKVSGLSAVQSSFVDANAFWLGDVNSPILRKVARDLSGFTSINLPRAGAVNQIASGLGDGTIWTMQGGTGTAAVITQISSSGAILRVVEGLPVSAQSPGLLFPLDRAILWLSSAGSGAVRSIASITPDWVDPSVPPAPPAGRGAGW